MLSRACFCVQHDKVNNVNQAIHSVSHLVSVSGTLGCPSHSEISLAQILSPRNCVLNIEYGLIGSYFAIVQHFQFLLGQKNLFIFNFDSKQCYISLSDSNFNGH